MTPKNRLAQQAQDKRFLHRIILILSLALFALVYAIWRIPNQFTVYIPPDVSKGFVTKVDDVPLDSIYGFARILWESINFCDQNCGQEYPKMLDTYRNYLTNRCHIQLSEHYQQNRELYQYRSRLLLPTEKAMFSTNSVRRIADETWYVNLEYELRDEVSGMKIRSNVMYYPIKVVKSYRPTNVNPIGLEVDCFFGDGPVLIKKEALGHEL